MPVVLHFRLLVADCLFGADYTENTEKDSPPMQGRGRRYFVIHNLVADVLQFLLLAGGGQEAEM